MSLEIFEQNVGVWLDKVKAEHWESGKAWYKQAYQFAKYLSEDTGLPLENVAGVIAALSPQVSWETNCYSAESVVRYAQIDKRYGGYYANVEKAYQCLTAHPLKVLGGAKVLAFYHNILNPHSPEYVTVDTHIARVLFDTLTLTNQQISYIFSYKGNSLAQQCLRKVASQHKVNVVALQAALWLCAREYTQNRVNKDQLDLYIK